MATATSSGAAGSVHVAAGGGGTTGTAAGGPAGGGLLAPTPAPPAFTPVIFCLPTEGASLSLAPLASTSTTVTASEPDSSATGNSGATAGAAATDGGGGDGHGASKALPAALLPIANRPLIAYVLQQLVSAGLRHAIVCAPAAQHSLFAHTLRQLGLTAPNSTAPASATQHASPNVQVLIDPLPGTSRRATPSANTYVLRVDLVPLGPADRADKNRVSAAANTATTASGSLQNVVSQHDPLKPGSGRKLRPFGSAELLLWLASEGWLEADPLVLPYDILTPSLPLSTLIRSHYLASALLPSTTFAPGFAPGPAVPSQPLLLGATTLLIEKRTAANTRSKAAQGDAASKERLKAERKNLAELGSHGERLVVYSKEPFGALHGFGSSTLAAPHPGASLSHSPAATSGGSGLVTEAPHSAHALLFSSPLAQVKAKSDGTSFVLPAAVGRRSLSSASSSPRSSSQNSIAAAAHISTSLVDSGVYIFPRSLLLPLLERFSSGPLSSSGAEVGSTSKIRTLPHLLSLLARASADEGVARKLGIDTLARRLARTYAQTHAERAGLGPVVPFRSGTVGGGGGDESSLHASVSASVLGGGGGAAGGGAGLADSLVLSGSGSAVGTGHATPGVGFASPPLGALGARSPQPGTTTTTLPSHAANAADRRSKGTTGSSAPGDALLASLGAGMSRLNVSIATAQSSASRSSLTGERSSTAVREFITANGKKDGLAQSASSPAPAQIRVQAVIARLQTEEETFVLGGGVGGDEGGAPASSGAGGGGGGGKGKGGSQATAAVLETERFFGRVDTPSRYLEANKFLLRVLAAPSPSTLFPVPHVSEAGTLGTAPPLPSSPAPGSSSASSATPTAPAQPQITPDALIASSSSVSLGDRCVIRRSVIGKGCTIARGAKILGCVVLPGTSVGENAKLESVVLGPHTTVGARSTLVDVDAGPEGVRIGEGTEAKVRVYGHVGRKGAGSKTDVAQAAAVPAGLEDVVGLVAHAEDSDEDSDEDEEEEDSDEDE